MFYICTHIQLGTSYKISFHLSSLKPLKSRELTRRAKTIEAMGP